VITGLSRSGKSDAAPAEIDVDGKAFYTVLREERQYLPFSINCSSTHKNTRQRHAEGFRSRVLIDNPATKGTGSWRFP